METISRAALSTQSATGFEEDFSMNAGKHATEIGALIQNLQDADQVIRLHAATLLGSMGDAAERAVPVLIELLQADDVHDRRLAALTLGEIGPVAEEAIPALLEAADDEDECVCELAVAALERIDLAEDEAEAA
jgi:HEAT repeat protein